MPLSSLVVTFHTEDEDRAIIAAAVEGAGRPIYLEDVGRSARPAALREAGAVLAFNISEELTSDELSLISNALLLQFVTAGVDHISLRALPRDLRVATNGGAFAEAMAEHVLAMALAAAKRLLVEHCNLQRGDFNHFTLNRSLSGAVCGIFGYGGIGTAAACLMRCVGMHIYAINRRGARNSMVEWVGTPEQLDYLLRMSDVLIVSTPLTRATNRRIGARELGLMKPDAILVNVARGEIIDQAALYDHLCRNPNFTACIDAWWVEPVRHGKFKLDHPLLDLPNVIGSPHNSAAVPGVHQIGLQRAVENCRVALSGHPPLHVIGSDERMR